MYTNFDEMPITLSVEQAAEALSISAVSQIGRAHV